MLDQNLAAYESTVLLAMQDVEDALNAFAKEQVRRKSLADASEAAGRAEGMSRGLYVAGLKDFLTVLDAQSVRPTPAPPAASAGPATRASSAPGRAAAAPPGTSAKRSIIENVGENNRFVWNRFQFEIESKILAAFEPNSCFFCFLV